LQPTRVRQVCRVEPPGTAGYPEKIPLPLRNISGASRVVIVARDIGQQDVMAFLDTPVAYGPGVTRVERFDTHISAVLLARDRAFKLKRAVHFPYVDYSTLEARRTFCDKEIRLNRRTAPDLYQAVVPVTRAENGALTIGGTGNPVEWLVEMRRFDQKTLLDAVARRGALGVELAAAIGVAAAKLHAVAEPRRDHGGASAMHWVVDENDAELSAAGAVVSQSVRARLHEASLPFLRRHGDLLDARRDAGWVRECHGDLHLGNIFLADGQPVLFACIEFNDDLSCIDVLYDLAFLVMDLLHRNLPVHANAALNAWFDRLPQYDALPLLPFFLSCRAAIRSKVSITATGVTSDPALIARLQQDARVYLDEALRLITPGTGAIVAIGGLSGSGKSTLARRLAAEFGRPPGALILRSDVARKRRFGVEPAVRLPNSAYAPRVNAAVYEELTLSAREVARSGYVAIVDAVFGTDALRRALRDAASHEGVPFLGLWLDAPIEIMEARLSARGADASDADVDVLRQQQPRVTAPDDWKHIDASRPIEEVAEAALASVADSIGMTATIHEPIH
jgi:aminoglycoside phosphotransferase family enzyme/predicted kinase